MFDFRRIALFCLEKRFSKHKMTIFSENFWGLGSFGPRLAMPMRVLSWFQCWQAMLVASCLFAQTED